MWTLRSQFNRPNAESNSTELEWSAVMVNTEAEAEAWWRCRTAQMQPGSVATMMNPNGEVIRVRFG